jgi:hypothetical protein
LFNHINKKFNQFTKFKDRFAQKTSFNIQKDDRKIRKLLNKRKESMNIISTKQIDTSIKEFSNENFDLNYNECAQNFENNQERSTYSNIQDFHISISFQDVQDSDIEIDANEEFVKKFVSFNSNLMKNDNIRISNRLLLKNMFNFNMILNL